VEMVELERVWMVFVTEHLPRLIRGNVEMAVVERRKRNGMNTRKAPTFVGVRVFKLLLL